MYDKANTTVANNEKPDFHKILDSLREQVDFSQELMHRTYHLTESLKPLPEEKSNGEILKSKDPSGFVDLLWHEIWRLRDINQTLNKSVNHLNTITA